MSKEFEEIVLKKLDMLNQKTSNTDKVIQNTILKKLDNLENDVKDNNQRLGNLEIEVKDVNQRIENLEIQVKVTGESILELRQRFAIFDFEINRKIDTLFDSDTVNKENIVSLNVKNDNHDTRISNLENKDIQLVKI